MDAYIEKTYSGTSVLDLDSFMNSMNYENTIRFMSDIELRRHGNADVAASYTHRNNRDIYLDFYWGLRHVNCFPAGYPKDGINEDGKAIWESCFVITFLTSRSVERGRAKKIILPTFECDAKLRCEVKMNRRCGKTMQVARCSESQLWALRAILERFEATGDEEDIEFVITNPCELAVQNG